MEINRKGLLIVLSAPSGAGKTSIVRSLLESDPQLEFSVSATTRNMRVGEIHGHDYHFLSADEFATGIEQDCFLEHAKVFHNHYGTPSLSVQNKLSQGIDLLCDIDWQGNRQIALNFHNHLCNATLVSIFILPPSMQELERRLRSRGQDSQEEIERRMQVALDEISHCHEYDYIIINHNLNEAVQQVRSIIQGARLRTCNYENLDQFVKNITQ